MTTDPSSLFTTDPLSIGAGIKAHLVADGFPAGAWHWVELHVLRFFTTRPVAANDEWIYLRWDNAPDSEEHRLAIGQWLGLAPDIKAYRLVREIGDDSLRVAAPFGFSMPTGSPLFRPAQMACLPGIAAQE